MRIVATIRLRTFERDALVRISEASADEIDPGPTAVVVSLFERYALGTDSARQLAIETGLAESRIRMILMNPLYNGWIRRHRGKEETRRPAPWRADPPVSDELWARVEEVRRSKTRGGGPRHRGELDLLRASWNASAAGASARMGGWATRTGSRSSTRALHRLGAEVADRSHDLGDPDPRPARLPAD